MLKWIGVGTLGVRVYLFVRPPEAITSRGPRTKTFEQKDLDGASLLLYLVAIDYIILQRSRPLVDVHLSASTMAKLQSINSTDWIGHTTHIIPEYFLHNFNGIYVIL